MTHAVLGISAYYHDSAAALLKDGRIVAAAQEERFTRNKHDSSFPVNAVKYVLHETGRTLADLDAVAFYDKPYLKFERLLETYHAFSPEGLKSFLSAMPIWIKEKLFMRKIVRDELAKIGSGKPRLLFPEHHLSHSASAFFPSPFEEAAILTVDGVGEWATTVIGYGNGNTIEKLCQIDFPHSLGLLYSAFTFYCGFKVNSGEYKLMGLAPYGNPAADETLAWVEAIKNEIIDIRDDGSFLLNMSYFNYATGLTMCNEKKWEALFGIPRRRNEDEIDQKHMNLSLAIQLVTEDVMLRLAKTAQKLTKSKHLTMAGGVALNCVSNGKLLREGIFKDIWIQPAAGDAGAAAGAAFAAWHIWKGEKRVVAAKPDAMQGAYLGPRFSELDIERIIHRFQAPFTKYEDFDELCLCVADFLADGKVVGWFQGRMEYGPRALGNRSILGDPRNPEMQKKMNMHIKYREGFRPFAPSVLEEDFRSYFDLYTPSPYMLMVAPVQPFRQIPYPSDFQDWDLYHRLYYIRSDIPAVTHVDYSARIQTVSREANARYWKLIQAFKHKTGYGLVVNTSFNVRGEPIVCTPHDAYVCFMRTEIDFLVMENYLFDKTEQPQFQNDTNWAQEYELD